MIRVLHQNSGDCKKCDMVLDRYPGFHIMLRAWFKAFQGLHPEAHISCAGRGELDQEAAFTNKTSRAHYGESAHNYNAAIDLFEMRGDSRNIYERDWFVNILKPALEPWQKWYGREGSPYPELPHVEVSDWKFLAKTGALSLVEA